MSAPCAFKAPYIFGFLLCPIVLCDEYPLKYITYIGKGVKFLNYGETLNYIHSLGKFSKPAGLERISLALKKLHSRLRIGDGKTDENFNERKITP